MSKYLLLSNKVKVDYKHYISVFITVCFVVCTLSVFYDSIFRLLQSFIDLFLSIKLYVHTLFDVNTSVLPFSKNYFEFPNASIPIDIVPNNWSLLKEKFSLFGELFINGNNFSSYFNAIMNKITMYYYVYTLIALIIVSIYLFVDKQVSTVNNKYNKDSKCLKAYKKAVSNILPIRNTIFEYCIFLRLHRFYLVIWALIWLFNFNIFSIIVSFFGYVLCFGSMHFILFDSIYSLFCDLSLLYKMLPWWLALIIGIKLFDIWRKSIGFSILEHMENKNKGFINSLPIVTLTVGTMGKNKTTLLTDNVLSQEVIFRDKALELMRDCDLEFPNFPWINFEKEIESLIRKGILFNLASCKRYIRNIRRLFELLISNKKYKNFYERTYHKFMNGCFDYDYKKFGLYHNDELNLIYLFDTLEDYIQLYFIYIIDCALHLSNYSIREDNIIESEGNFPKWNTGFFNKNVYVQKLNSNYSKILDFDVLRLGLKMVKNNINKDCFEFGIVVITEVGKERGNQVELKGVKKDDTTANQYNDLFNKWLKMVRHSATVRHFPFVKVYMDEQRAESLGADARDLATIINIDTKDDKKIVMPFFFISELLDVLFGRVFNSIYSKYRYSRGDNTLFIYLLHNIYAKWKKYYTNRYNLFGCIKMSLSIADGASVAGKKNNVDPSQKNYYLLTKKIYSNRFATDCHSGFFERKALRSTIGVRDLLSFENTMPSLSELNCEHSYFITELVDNFECDGATKDNVENEKNCTPIFFGKTRKEENSKPFRSSD